LAASINAHRLYSQELEELKDEKTEADQPG
jgi:hypothetical protein